MYPFQGSGSLKSNNVLHSRDLLARMICHVSMKLPSAPGYQERAHLPKCRRVRSARNAARNASRIVAMPRNKGVGLNSGSPGLRGRDEQDDPLASSLQATSSPQPSA